VAGAKVAVKIFKDETVLRYLKINMSLIFWCFKGKTQVIAGVFFKRDKGWEC
jgi:hypothetical protein